MKQRITFVLPEGASVDPADIEVNNDSLFYSGASSVAQERKITAGLSELPEELQIILEQCHELHLRIVTTRPYVSAPPLVSRVSSGLHAFFTPRNPDVEVEVCPLLKLLFGSHLKCDSVADSFSRQPVLSKRFATSSTFQYYQSHPNLECLLAYAQNTICRQPGYDLKLSEICAHEAAIIAKADSIDIDYDAISHAITVAAFSSADRSKSDVRDSDAMIGVSRNIQKVRKDDRIEVGVLSPELSTEPEELGLAGFLTVVGEDSRPSATKFDFPSRHHPLPAGKRTSYRTAFDKPTGLHPKLAITLDRRTLLTPRHACALHAYLTLPSAVFIDKYQLSDALFLRSQNLASLRAISGEQDLEAPEWATKLWGSAALLELVQPNLTESSPASDWKVTIPMHMRYLAPVHDSSTPGYENVDVPWPIIFWACEAEEGLKMSVNPFDRVNLGYDGLFGPKTMFYHVPPAHSDSLLETVGMPLLDNGKTAWIPTITTAVVILGFGWISWRLIEALWHGASVDNHKKSQ